MAQELTETKRNEDNTDGTQIVFSREAKGGIGSDAILSDQNITVITDDDVPPPNLEKQGTHAPELDVEKKMKFIHYNVLTVVIVATVLVVGKAAPNIGFYGLISLILAIALIVWCIHFLTMVFSFDHLHYIRIKRRRSPNATKFFIPYGFEEKPHRPLDSISMLISNRGSNAERSYSQFSWLSFGLILSAVLLKWTEDTTAMREIDVELIVLLLVVRAFQLIGIWELEHNAFAITVHYVSMGTCVVVGPISLALFQDFSGLSIVVMCVCFTIFCGWAVFMIWLRPQRFDVENESDMIAVHKYSLISLLLEVMVLSSVYVTVIVFVYCMDDGQKEL